MTTLAAAPPTRRPWDRLLVATLAPVAVLAAVVAPLTQSARTDRVVASGVSPNGSHTVEVHRVGGAGNPTYPVVVDTGSTGMRIGCVDGSHLSQPAVQWLDDDHLRVTILDGQRADVATVSVASGTPVEQPATGSLHSC